MSAADNTTKMVARRLQVDKMDSSKMIIINIWMMQLDHDALCLFNFTSVANFVDKTTENTSWC